MDSSSRPIRKFAVSASAIGAALAIFPALNSNPGWADESLSRLPAVEVLRRRAFDPNPPDRKIILNQSGARKTLPLWQRTVTALGKNYPVMMVGKDPRKPLADPTTAIKTVIVPVRLTMPAESPSDPPLAFDPTLRDPKCSPAGKPIDLTLASPVFKPMTVDKLGTAQLGTLYQRANLNELTSGGGPNPNYTIVLNPVTAPKQIIDDEKTDVGAAWRTAKCGLRASVNILKLTRHIEKVLFPQLRKNGVNPQVLPIFLFYNTSFRDDEREGTYGGFHDFFWNNGVFQTYIVASFDTSFDKSKPYQDVYVLAHEVAEWMADPDIYNPTPPWGNFSEL